MRGEKKVTSFKDLKVWRKAFDLSLRVYRITAGFPKSEMHGLVNQMRRSSVSIVGNIAEGHARRHRREYLQFLNVAYASAAELETYLLLAKELGYIGKDEEPATMLVDEVQRMLYGLRASLLVSSPSPLTPHP